MLDAPHHVADSHDVTDHVLILEYGEKAIDEVSHQMLRAETDREAGQSRCGCHRRHVEAELRQRRQDRDNNNDRRPAAVKHAGEGLRLLLAHPSHAAGAFRSRITNQPPGKGAQQPDQNDRQYENGQQARSAPQGKLSPLGYVVWHMIGGR